jgi:hypothetical protein
MTIEVELNAKTQALLAARAAARTMDLRVYAATLLEQAASESAPGAHPLLLRRGPRDGRA